MIFRTTATGSRYFGGRTGIQGTNTRANVGPTPVLLLFPPIRTDTPILLGSQVMWSHTSLQRPQPMHFFSMMLIPIEPSGLANDSIALTGQTICTSGTTCDSTFALDGRHNRIRSGSYEGAAP